MDAETTIRLLKKYGGCIVTDHEGIIRLNSDSLIKLLKEQEKYAELGRLALDLMSTGIAPCGFGIHDGVTVECEQEKCSWLEFCQKRAELLLGEQDGQ